MTPPGSPTCAAAECCTGGGAAMAPPESPATESGVAGGGTLGCWGGRASRDSTASNCCRVSGAAEAAARPARTGHTLDLSGGETSGITTLFSTAPIVTSRSVAFEVLSPIWTICTSSFSITTLSLILPAASSMSDVASSAWTTAALRLRRLARTGRESTTHVVVGRSGVLTCRARRHVWAHVVPGNHHTSTLAAPPRSR